MNRYSIALSALLSSTAVSAESPWSYLSIGIPIALSDMAVSVVTVDDDSANGNNDAADDTAGVNSTAAVVNGGDGGTKKKIVLTGGCISDKGNEWMEGDDGYGFYACTELTNKVCYCLYSGTRQHSWGLLHTSESTCDLALLSL